MHARTHWWTGAIMHDNVDDLAYYTDRYFGFTRTTTTRTERHNTSCNPGTDECKMQNSTNKSNWILTTMQWRWEGCETISWFFASSQDKSQDEWWLAINNVDRTTGDRTCLVWCKKLLHQTATAIVSHLTGQQLVSGLAAVAYLQHDLTDIAIYVCKPQPIYQALMIMQELSQVDSGLQNLLVDGQKQQHNRHGMWFLSYYLHRHHHLFHLLLVFFSLTCTHICINSVYCFCHVLLAQCTM